MKTIKSVITLAFMLFFCLSMQAQSAGTETVVVERKADGSQLAVIGPPIGSEPASYHWEGPHIYSLNANNPQIVINPQDDGEEYTLTRISACGVEQSVVVVRLIDIVAELESVVPLRDCYNIGEPVSLSDFQIVTNPPGYEDLVTVTPNHAPTFDGFNSVPVQFNFVLNHEGHISYKTVELDVYNSEFLNYNPTANLLDIDKFIHQLETIRNYMQEFKDINKVLAKMKVSPGLIEPQFNFNVPIPNLSNFRIKRSCCQGNDAYGFLFQYPSITMEFGVEVNVPTPWSIKIPFVNFRAGVFIYGDILFGLSLGPFNLNIQRGCREDKIIPLAVYADFELGAKAILADEDALSATLGIAAHYQFSKDWNMSDKFRFPPVDVDLSIKGSVKTLSLFSIPVDFHLFSVQLFNN